MYKRLWLFLATIFLSIGIVACDEAEVSQTENSNVIEIDDEKKAEETEQKESEEDKATEKEDEIKAEQGKAVKEEKAVPAAPASSKETKSNSVKQEEPVKKPTDTSGTTDKVPVKLVKTIDGDTIKVIYNGQEQNVRYLLIDTPETSHPRLGKQPFGEEAKERNRALVNSGELTLEFDVGERVDKYGRLLAYVYVGGKSVQQTLIEEGLARVAYVYPPNTRHLDPYKEAEQRAKDKKLGIWSIEDYASDSGFDSAAAPAPKKSNSNSGASSAAPKQENKSNSSSTSQKSNNAAPKQSAEQKKDCNIKGSNSGIYHVPGSTYYDRTTNVAQWFCSTEEAEKAGYRAPKR